MKLIIINGTSGSGKTSVSRKLHCKRSLSVMIPNYEVRRMISDFKKDREKSRKIMFNLIYGLVDQALVSGVDVILDSKIHDDFTGNSFVDKLLTLGKARGAETYELILVVDKEKSIDRIRSRGFSEGGILTEENLEENVSSFLEKMNNYINSRENPIIIDTSMLTEEDVFNKVTEVVGY